MKKTTRSAILSACACAASAASAAPAVFVNEDNQHFYERPAEEMSVAGCRALVDFYADAGGVKGMLFCVNLQRALYDSEVWERFRDIEDGSRYVAGLRLLSERKVDNFAVWLDRARERGMEAWLTMRMNDSHGLKEAVQGIPSRFARGSGGQTPVHKCECISDGRRFRVLAVFGFVAPLLSRRGI